MLPSLKDGDEIEVDLEAAPRPGDVALYLDGTVSILHRVLTAGDPLLLQGDGSPRPDAPIPRARILGVAKVPPRRGLALRRRIVHAARSFAKRLLGRK